MRKIMDIKLYIDLAGAFLETILLAYFLHASLGTMRHRLLWRAVALTLLVLVSWSISYLAPYAYMRTLLYGVAYGVMAVWGYEGRSLTKLFVGVIYLLLSALVENIVHAILMLAAGETFVLGSHALQDYIMGLAVSKLVLVFLTGIWSSVLKRSKLRRGQLAAGNFGLLMLFPLATLFVFYVIYYAFIVMGDMEGIALMLSMTVFLIMANLGLFVLYERLLDANGLEREHLRTLQQMQKQQAHYMALNERNQELYSWRHEMNNLMTAISGYLKEEQYDKAQELIIHCKKELDQPIKSRTGNLALDTLLAEKQLAAQKIGSDISYRIAPGLNFELDIVVVLIVVGNGLDNALEAVAKLDELVRGQITCRMDLLQGWLKIIITNPVAQPVPMIGTKLPPTDKRDKQAHGLGLSTVRQLTELHKGWLELRCDADIFCFEAVLENKEPSNYSPK